MKFNEFYHLHQSMPGLERKRKLEEVGRNIDRLASYYKKRYGACHDCKPVYLATMLHNCGCKEAAS